MQTFTSTDVAKRFGAIAQIVQREPVSVQAHGRPQLVMLAPEEYARLRRLDRKVYSTKALPDTLRRAIAAAQPPDEAADFNHEVGV